MTDLMNKAKAFETKNIPHPEGKKSKKTGEVLKVTQYHFGGKVYGTADVITLDKNTRFLIEDLTDAEYKQVKTLKGDKVLRDIMTRCHALAKKIENTATSSGVILEHDKRVATNDFVRSYMATALDRLMQVKEEKSKVALPF
jgi:hypothetical protein